MYAIYSISLPAAIAIAQAELTEYTKSTHRYSFRHYRARNIETLTGIYRCCRCLHKHLHQDQWDMELFDYTESDR